LGLLAFVMTDAVALLRAELTRLMMLMAELREEGNPGLASLLEDVAAKYLTKLADAERRAAQPASQQQQQIQPGDESKD
jgi:hypothetical protein